MSNFGVINKSTFETMPDITQKEFFSPDITLPRDYHVQLLDARINKATLVESWNHQEVWVVFVYMKKSGRDKQQDRQ